MSQMRNFSAGSRIRVSIILKKRRLLWADSCSFAVILLCSKIESLMLGKNEAKRRRGLLRMRWLDGNDRLNGHEFEQTQGDSGGQRSLVCCSPWGHKELDTA